MYNLYYNGIKRMVRDGRAGIPKLSRVLYDHDDSDNIIYNVIVSHTSVKLTGPLPVYVV